MTDSTASITKRYGFLWMEVLPPSDADDGDHTTLRHKGEDGFVTILTVPTPEYPYLQPGDTVMVDIIVTKLGQGETIQQ